MKKTQIGILYICTGKYNIFWKDFYLSMEKNFIKDEEKHYFVFTDSSDIEFEYENNNIHKIYQENLGWPDNTLMRFHIFLKIEKELMNMDYLFFFNANLLVLEEIKKEEFLPTKEEKLVATIHPGFYNKERRKFTYEENNKSTAFINRNEGDHYFAGGLNGGNTIDFISAMKEMKFKIDTDNKDNITAEWHDESHWNRYLINKFYIKKLDPGYLYPEGWSIPFAKKILIRDKNRYGGHSKLRNKTIYNLKYFLIKVYNKTIDYFYSLKNPLYSNFKILELKNTELLIVTIAFNNSEIIKIQSSNVLKNLNDDFDYIIADNSSDKKHSDETRRYCESEKIKYIKLPKNSQTKDPSKSHGLAINWVYRNLVKKIEPKYFGFIDQDILAFKNTQISNLIDGKVFGLIQERDTRWYLWPGFCFFNYIQIKDFNLNFMPTDGLDTGGANYESLYRYINKETINKIPHNYIDLKGGIEIKRIGNDFTSKIERIGDWIHLMRLSSWDGQANSKIDNIEYIIKTTNSLYGK